MTPIMRGHDSSLATVDLSGAQSPPHGAHPRTTLQEKGGPPDTLAGTSRPDAEARHSRRDGVVLVIVGVLLLVLAGSDALAGTSLGGYGDDTVRGSPRKEVPIGFGGEDDLRGFAGDDVLNGGENDDELYGGAGHDALFAGGGDDFVEAKDGQRDYVECGSGDDQASVDARDYVARSCETVFPG